MAEDKRRSIWRDVVIALSVATLVVCGLLFFTGRGLDLRSTGLTEGVYLPPAPARRLGAKDDPIHVVLSSDDTDLRGVAVAMQSMYTNARNPERLRFHLITPPQFANAFKELLTQQLPMLPLEVHSDSQLQARILAFIDHRAGSLVRKRDASPYLFSPYYLRYYLRDSKAGKIGKVVFLHTDTVVLGDIGEVYDYDLGPHAVGTVKRCAEVWENYINVNALKSMGYDGYNPQACVTTQALLVIDLVKWKRQNMTGKIESWMQIHRGSKDDLWYNSLALPPLLLAMNGAYADLGKDWGCDGAGQERMSVAESQVLRRSGFDRKAFRELGVKHSVVGNVQPYVATCTASAKLLHFSGTSKPWSLEMLDRQSPVCALPMLMPPSKTWEWRKDVKVFCEAAAFVACSEIWLHFISEQVACELKDFDKEWQDDEDKFLNQQMMEEWKVDVARKERQRLEMEQRQSQAKEVFEAKEREAREAEERRKREEQEAEERERQARIERARIEAETKKEPAALPPDIDDEDR